MKTNTETKILIDTYEFGDIILKYLADEDFLDKYLKCQLNGENPILKQGFMLGMCIASLLTSQCTQYITSSAKKPEFLSESYTAAVCPVCKSELFNMYEHYCSSCGQELNWESNE